MTGLVGWLNTNKIELIIIAAIVIAFLLLRTPSEDISFEEVVSPGETTILELFSNT